MFYIFVAPLHILIPGRSSHEGVESNSGSRSPNRVCIVEDLRRLRPEKPKQVDVIELKIAKASYLY